MSTELSQVPSDPPKKSSRIVTFDLMRGYFLIAIILNHLHYFPNGIDWLTMRGQLFVSSAEGFFFISGIVLGVVRGAKLVNKPFKDVLKLLLKRALQLYLVYIIITIIFTLIGWLFFMDNPGLKPGILAADTPFWTMVWQVLSFEYLYGWADYLRLYCIFLLVSPLVMWLLRRGYWWVALAGSVSVWLLTPFTEWPASVMLQPFNWQLIFFGGMIVGYHWEQISGFWRSIAKGWRQAIIATTVALCALTLAGNLYLAYGGKINDDIFYLVSPIRDMLWPYFDKENMPLARLALFSLWFWGAFWFFHRFEKQLLALFDWILLPFGTNSLYVYIVSGVLIFFVHLFLPIGGAFINFLIVFGIVAAIWFMIRYKVLMKVIPR